jgi:hypothetical protein
MMRWAGVPVGSNSRAHVASGSRILRARAPSSSYAQPAAKLRQSRE